MREEKFFVYFIIFFHPHTIRHIVESVGCKSLFIHIIRPSIFSPPNQPPTYIPLFSPISQQVSLSCYYSKHLSLSLALFSLIPYESSHTGTHARSREHGRDMKMSPIYHWHSRTKSFFFFFVLFLDSFIYFCYFSLSIARRSGAPSCDSDMMNLLFVQWKKFRLLFILQYSKVNNILIN